ncbi:MAG: GAF domain-containing protein [Anaerolineales bacterium]|nr:GAF domain-containing protein [Anaerolineales bacterium]
MKENFPEETKKNERFTHKLWRWFIAPSPRIEERDQRRQATLLSSLLLGIIILASLVESTTVALTEIENYTGYRHTIAEVVILTVIYLLSRTHYVRLTGVLSVISLSLAGFITALAEPSGILGGLLDYLIISIWIGSLFLKPGELALLMIANLIGLLFVPLFVPSIPLNDILIGPFSFILVTSILIILLTRHRNLIERDRRAELAEKEEYSRHAAARAEVLLRVAERLNAQLDLDTLMKAISEEVVQAFGTQVSLVMLYDEREKALLAVAGLGLSPDSIRDIPPFSKDTYDQTVELLSPVFTLADLQAIPDNTYLNEFKRLNFRSIAFATMHYENELVGSLSAITLGQGRNFTEDELLLLHGLADQAALAIINTRLFKDARRRLEHLQALRAIDIAIASNHDLQETLDVFLDQIMKQLQVDAAAILLLDETKGQLEFGASRGFQTSTLRYTRLRVGEGMAGRAAQQHQTVHVRDLRIDPQSLINAPSLAKEGFVSYYAAPLISQGKVKGVLEIFHRSLLDHSDKEWLDFMEALAGQAAIAIESTTLFQDLQHTNEELSQAYDSTIVGWSHALDLRDKETEGHTRRVTELTLELARVFGFSEAELIHTRRGALLHDIGKMGVPDKILLKEGPLDPDEWDIMRQHPVFAHEMLVPINYLRPALDIPYCHHEKWDGTGYPRGLKGAEIPLIARIFAVVDVWDALTSDRPYRAAWAPEKALAHIEDGTGQHFDPDVVEIFVDFMKQIQWQKINKN